MIINFYSEKLNRILQDFYNATGVNLSLLREDFTPFCDNPRPPNSYCGMIHSTQESSKACMFSDIKLLEKCKASRRTETHICHAGLVDVAVPILYQDSVLGYIILGQMKNDEDFSAVKDYILSLGLEQKTMESMYKELPLFDLDRVKSVSHIAEMLAKHILFENILSPSLNSSIERARDFIENNLEKDLSIRLISKKTGISKSVLYKNFHTYFNCTVTEFINMKRVERSVELLSDRELSIEEISQAVGFSSASYFSRIFKKQKGIAPLKFRKAQSE